MCSMIDSGEKGYKLPEQILFNSLVLYLTLERSLGVENWIRVKWSLGGKLWSG